MFKLGVIKFVWRSVIIAFIIILLTVFLLGIAGEIDKIRRTLWGVEKGVSFYNYNVSNKLRKEVATVISSYAQSHIRYPLPAAINEETGAVVPETKGKIIDITATVDKIFSAKQGETVKEISYLINPDLKKEDLLCLTEEIASYQTPMLGAKKRKENIKLAAHLINNTLLTAEEIFSFNEEVGPRTKQRGFKESPQIVEGELILGVGGGICQVSSTLYNVLVQKELKIIEHHHHSQEVGYVPEGQDAAVAWDYLDLKFKNNLVHPIIIKAGVKGGQLQVDLLGPKD